MKDYILINKKVLPKSFQDVLKVKTLIEVDGESVTDACKKYNISRSTYYKYSKDIQIPEKNVQKKAMIMIKTVNSKGVLSNILNLLANNNCNVLTINQDLPIRNVAYITLLVDVIELGKELDDLALELKHVENVKKVDILSYE